MKSKRAQEHIINNLLIVKGSRELLLSSVTATSAVEIAEADRDAKAVEAFKQMCSFNDGRCRPNCEGCGRLNRFIQKLNE